MRRARDSLGVKAERKSVGTSGAGRWLWRLDSARCSSTPQDAQVFSVSPLQEFEHLADEPPVLCALCGKPETPTDALLDVSDAGGAMAKMHYGCTRRAWTAAEDFPDIPEFLDRRQTS